jgi:Spy/CpxP family protein refolding chaperone
MNGKILSMMLLLAGAPAFAQTTPADGGEARIDRRMEKLSEQLGLDKTEQVAVRATMEKFHAQLSPLREQAWKARHSLREELQSKSPDEQKVSQLTDKLASARKQMRVIEAKRMEELRGELTPSQFAKLQLHERRFGRRFHHEKG